MIDKKIILLSKVACISHLKQIFATKQRPTLASDNTIRVNTCLKLLLLASLKYIINDFDQIERLYRTSSKVTNYSKQYYALS